MTNAIYKKAFDWGLPYCFRGESMTNMATGRQAEPGAVAESLPLTHRQWLERKETGPAVGF